MIEDKTSLGINRRGLIGASLVAAGAVVGAIVRKAEPIQPVSPNPDSRFTYDVSEFEKTDPALLRYKESHQFETGFQTVGRIATAGSNIWVAGDESLKLFSSEGKAIREIPLGFKPHCLQAIDEDVLVGSQDFFVMLDRSGKVTFKSPPAGCKAYFTAIQAHQEAIYIGDAGNREILICDRKTGSVIDRFGKANATNPGFAIPSAYFDLHITADDRLRVANTGRLRIETYSLAGRFESTWGEAGMKIDRFCGCCNPVYFAMTPQGDFITSEKGLARINIYSAEGKFKGAVAGPDTLIEDKELARRACVDCRIGAGFDVAVDVNSRVFALDPYKKIVRCFSPI